MKKVALITGSSRGIGFAIAKKLGEDGFSLALAARGPQEKAEENLRVISDEGIEWIYIQADISKAEDRKRIVDETFSSYSRIDVLVNNAGVAPTDRRDLLEMTEESFDRVVGINAKGNMFLTQLVANRMLKQEKRGEKRGTIINVSSCSAEIVSTNRAEYCVSKAAVSMLTRLYASRLAGDGILVHEIRPGVIATDMTSGVKAKYDALIEAGAFPIARWGRPEDIAECVSVLADDHFLYTTGDHIDIDGGYNIKTL